MLRREAVPFAALIIVAWLSQGYLAGTTLLTQKVLLVPGRITRNGPTGCQPITDGSLVKTPILRRGQTTEGHLEVAGSMSHQPLQRNPEHDLSLSMPRPQMKIIIIWVSALFLQEKSDVPTLLVKEWGGEEMNGCLAAIGRRHQGGQHLLICLGRIGMVCCSTQMKTGYLLRLSPRHVLLRCKTSKGMAV